MGWIPARPGGKGAGFLSRTLEARERLSWLEGDIGVLMAGFLPVRLPIRDMGSFLGIEDGTGRVLSVRSRNVSEEMSYWL